MKVLVVDDNVTYLGQMKKYLSLHSLQVQTAECGEKALALMEKNYFDVVILDLKMPDISGIDVLQWAHEQGIVSKFIVITGYGRVDTAVKSMKLGAVDYLQKPFDPEVLLKLIKKTSDGVPSALSLMGPFPRANSKNLLKGICKGKNILAITDENLGDFFRPYKLKPVRHIVLSSHFSSDTLNPKKIVELRHEIENFIHNQSHALVVHGGLSVLLKIHTPHVIQDYLMYIHNIVKETGTQLIMLYESSKERDFLQNLEHIEPSTFIDDVVKIFDHNARCHILNLLARYKALHYTDFLKEMDIDISSNLAFHLKKLTALKLIEKRGNRYTLTDRGQYFVGILFSLAVGKYHDPTSNVIYYPLPST